MAIKQAKNISQFVKRFFTTNKTILSFGVAFLLAIGLALPLSSVLAQASLPSGITTGGDITDPFNGEAGGQFNVLTESGQVIPVACPLLGPGATLATSADIQNLINCVKAEADRRDEVVKESTMKQLKALKAKQAREEWLKKMEEELKKNLAGAFKASLSQFSKQLAKDTATWIASGGKGQQPLFVTEGWGAYLQNAADSALGDFLDQIGQRYGVDLCQPNFKIKVAIHTSLWQQRKVRCTFTQMMTNWSKAMNSNTFAFEYTNSMQPGENDISVFLTLQSDSMSYTTKQTKAAEDQAMADSGWKPVKDWAGRILTPGTAVRKAHELSMDKADKKDNIFTGTIWDFVETFLNTLIAQLLQNLANGLFTNNNNDNSSGSSDSSSVLYNSLASPANPGVAGAEERFNFFSGTKATEAGSYDILIKLIQCADKSNPGPTDCVIDQSLLAAIKDKKQVIDLPDDIKNRFFAPHINQSNSLESEIPLRSIVIMRKYRIVPIGWELAANIIKLRKDRNYTLGEVMNGFSQGGVDGDCSTNDPTDGSPQSLFCGLVDPYWVLKVPELYCRRQGFGGHDSSKNSQDGTISRDSYCADEQQCIKENTDGSCQAYGYCTEERRQWNFGASSSCDPRYNTCQVFTNTNGQDALGQALLANTLDFRYCNQSNAGCRWYSQSFNTISNIWTNYNPDHSLNTCGSTSACSASLSGTVLAWHSVSDDQRIRLSSPCTADTCRGISGCTFTGTSCDFAGTGNSCDVPRGGSSCRLDLCVPPTSLLSGSNSSFEDSGSKGAWDVRYWNLTFSHINNNNRQFRDSGGHTGSYALRSLTNYQTYDLVTSLDNVAVNTASKYTLKFFAKGQINSGTIIVGVDTGALQSQILSQGNLTSGWQEFAIPFSTQGNGAATIKIITSAGTWSNVYLDDFSLTEADDNCVPRGVTLTMGETTQSNKSMYFDRDAQTCSADAAGCSEFIRTKAGLGSNLIIGGDFEDAFANLQWVNDSGVAFISSVGATVPVHSGSNYLKFDSSGSNPEASSSVPVSIVAGKKYVLSIWVLANGTVASTTTFNLGLVNSSNVSQYLVSQTIPVANQWTRMKVSFVASATANLYPFVGKNADTVISPAVYFDDLKLEMVNYNINDPTSYSGYKPSERPSNQLSYLKFAPSYYSCYGTTTDGVIEWPQNRDDLLDVLARQNSACEKYAPVCTPQEVDCELYTPFNGDPAVPGIAQTADVCPSECDGYQVYQQKETNFVAEKYRQFIANSNAQYCSAAYAGCDEFTNLDKLGQAGGEKKEYFTYIKACQKPGLDDAPYYTWEGSDVTGYQLKVFRLKVSQSTSSDSGAPCTYLTYDSSGHGVCNDLGNSDSRYTPPSGVADLSALLDNTNNDVVSYVEKLTEPEINKLHDYGICVKQEISGYSSGTIDILPNSDCRQFYDASGGIHYRLLSKTVTASDDCHPYRRTMTQLDASEAGSDCAVKNGYWNATGECIYMGTPGDNESRTCPASAVGCRQYVGNRGNNVRNVLTSYFSSGDASSTDGWTDGTGAMTDVLVSMDSVRTGGYSMQNSGTGLIIKHGVKINVNKDYVLSFWAKGSGDLNVYVSSSPVNLYFNRVTSTPAGAKMMTPTTTLTGSWQRYELGPVFTNINPNSDNNQLVFKISSGGIVNLDSVVLKEMNQSTYVIENSWLTPVSCDNKIDDPSGAKAKSTGACTDDNGRCSYGEMLGCTKYADRSSQIFYLRSFASLCREKAAGCEAMINTHNSDSPYTQNYNVGDPSAVTSTADDMAYLVNDSAYGCLAGDKGCTAYGLPKISSYDEVLGYDNVYIKNQPDSYGNSLCRDNEVWCDEYKGYDSLFYFKNPRNKICEFAARVGDASAGAWYQKDTDQPCSTTLDQTFGYSANKPADKEQPLGIWKDALAVISYAAGDTYQGWAGSCPVTQNTCSEYVDPRTDIYTNYFRINNYVRPSEVPAYSSTDPVNVYLADYHRVNLRFHTLYSLSTNVVAGRVGVALICDKDVNIYSPDNSMSKYYAPIDPTDPSQGYWYWGDDLATWDHSTTTGHNSIKLIKTGLTTDQKDVSGRFYIDSASSTVHCRIYRNEDADTASIKIVPAGVYYTFANKVDKTSCNGLVDFRSGCVLFNDRSNINYQEMNDAVDKYTGYLSFNSDKTYFANIFNGQAKKVAPISAPHANDSNVIIKVQPDRTCQNWLYCNTYQKVASDTKSQFSNQDLCLGISTCSEINPKNGDCIQFENPSNSVISPTSPDIGYPGIQNLDGYSVPSDYRTSKMPEVGESASVTNGNFESYYANGKEPIGWYLPDGIKYDGDLENKDNPQENTYWDERKFSVEGKVTNLKNGLRYLRLNGAYLADSELIDVFGGTEYTVSGWINTLNLLPAGSKAMILISDPFHPACPPGVAGCSSITLGTTTWQMWSGLSVSSSLPWTRVQQVIKTNNGTTRLRLRLLNNKGDYPGCHDGKAGGCSIGGNSFFDDVAIKPSLKVNDNSYIQNSCRLYPAIDSPACQYNQNGTNYYGWLGYCLVNDPQNENICLQWWPVDNIKGDVIDEISSYSGRAPLYYCIASYFESHLVTKTAPSGPIKVTELLGSYAKKGTAPNCATIDPSELDNVTPEADIQKANIYNIVSIQLTDSDGGVKRTPCNDYGVHSFEKVGISLNLRLQAIYRNIYGLPALIDSPNALGYVSNDDLDKESTYCAGFVKFYDHNEGDHYKGDIKEIKVCAHDEGDYSHADSHGFQLKVSFMTEKIGACQAVAQTVLPAGTNKAWSKRTAQGSMFKLNDIGTVYSTDYGPYGSIVAPAKVNYPSTWDSKPNLKGRQPLYSEAPNMADYQKPYQARSGEVYGCISHTANSDAIISSGGILNFILSFVGLADSDSCLAACFSGVMDMQSLIKMVFDGSWADLAKKIPNLLTAIDCATKKCDDKCARIGHCTISGSICVRTPDQPEEVVSRQCPISGERCLTSSANKHKDDGINLSMVIGAGANRLKRLFAKSYGIWVWNDTKQGYVRESDSSSHNWDVPDTQCEGNFRKNGSRISLATNIPIDFCAIAPAVKNVRVNGRADDPTIGLIRLRNSGNGILEFNAFVNADQLPLSAYRVKWGDGQNVSYAGISLRDKSNPKNKFKLVHYYDYEQLKKFRGDTLGGNGVYCDGDDLPGTTTVPAQNECWTHIKIQIRDNWGWCNGTTTGVGYYMGKDTDTDLTYDCEESEAWKTYGPWVVVKEAFYSWDFGYDGDDSGDESDDPYSDEGVDCESQKDDGVCDTSAPCSEAVPTSPFYSLYDCFSIRYGDIISLKSLENNLYVGAVNNSGQLMVNSSLPVALQINSIDGAGYGEVVVYGDTINLAPPGRPDLGFSTEYTNFKPWYPQRGTGGGTLLEGADSSSAGLEDGFLIFNSIASTTDTGGTVQNHIEYDWTITLRGQLPAEDGWPCAFQSDCCTVWTRGKCTARFAEVDDKDHIWMHHGLKKEVGIIGGWVTDNPVENKNRFLIGRLASWDDVTSCPPKQHWDFTVPPTGACVPDTGISGGCPVGYYWDDVTAQCSICSSPGDSPDCVYLSVGSRFFLRSSDGFSQDGTDYNYNMDYVSMNGTLLHANIISTNGVPPYYNTPAFQETFRFFPVNMAGDQIPGFTRPFQYGDQVYMIFNSAKLTCDAFDNPCGGDNFGHQSHSGDVDQPFVLEGGPTGDKIKFGDIIRLRHADTSVIYVAFQKKDNNPYCNGLHGNSKDHRCCVPHDAAACRTTPGWPHECPSIIEQCKVEQLEADNITNNEKFTSRFYIEQSSY